MKRKDTWTEKRGTHRRLEKMAPWLFVAPFLIAFFAFFLFPLIYSLVLSFYSYKGYGVARFVGLQNYQKVFNYNMFWNTLRNTAYYYLAYVIPLIVISFLLALILHQKIVQRAAKLFKPLLFIPQIVPVVAGTLTFKIMFSTRTGAINTILGTEIPFLEDGVYMFWCTLALMLWRGIGWYMVVFTAGLTSVNQELVEAASIDGAGFWHRVFYIIIPIMKPIFLFAFIMNSINTFKLYTEPTVLLSLQNNVDATASPVMSLLIQNVKTGNFGMASAMGWILFVVIVGVTVLYFRVLGNDNTKSEKGGERV